MFYKINTLYPKWEFIICSLSLALSLSMASQLSLIFLWRYIEFNMFLLHSHAKLDTQTIQIHCRVVQNQHFACRTDTLYLSLHGHSIFPKCSLPNYNMRTFVFATSLYNLATNTLYPKCPYMICSLSLFPCYTILFHIISCSIILYHLLIEIVSS